MNMYPQHLPNYKHDFESFSKWLRHESENYTFSYTSGSTAEKDIQTIVTTQESAFQHIISTLALPTPTRKIRYFFYPDSETKKMLMGDNWYAQSIYNEFCIHVLYTEKDKPIGPHEDTHLLTLPWGLSWNFLQEGLAEYMVGHAWDGSSHKVKVQEGIKFGYRLYPQEQCTMKDWIDTPDEQAIYFYSLAGAWVSFLIQSYGLPAFKTLYQTTHRDMTREMVEKQYFTCLNIQLPSVEEKFFKTITTS